MPVGIALGTAAVGAGASIISGNKAASAQKQAAQQASDTQLRMFEQSRADMAPYRAVGEGALYKLADMYGVGRPTRMTNAPGAGEAGASSMTPGYGGFQASPGYQWRLDEGQKAVERSAAARGLLGSGATLKAIQNYGQNQASSEYENYANRLSALAGIGQTTTAQGAQLGQNVAGQVGQNQMAAGNASASAYANTGASIGSGLNNALYGYLRFGQGQGGGGGFGAPAQLPTYMTPGGGFGGGQASTPQFGYGNVT